MFHCFFFNIVENLLCAIIFFCKLYHKNQWPQYPCELLLLRIKSLHKIIIQRLHLFHNQIFFKFSCAASSSNPWQTRFIAIPLMKLVRHIININFVHPFKTNIGSVLKANFSSTRFKTRGVYPCCWCNETFLFAQQRLKAYLHKLF